MSLDPLEFFRCRDFAPLNHYFGRQMLRLAAGRGQGLPPETARALYLASGLVCHEAASGNGCVDLLFYAGGELKGSPEAGGEVCLALPGIDEWRAHLKATAVVGVPGGAAAPLILEESAARVRLYLYRYWQYERDLADFIRSRLAAEVAVDEPLLQQGLDRLFAAGPDAAGPDGQRAAAGNGVRKKFSVITGGPGTGKTTTVLKLLALLIEQAGGRPLQVELAAPTGKAAARLKESILAGKEKLLTQRLIPSELAVRLRAEASTLHRLLGGVTNSVYFRHNRLQPLALDCLIVDEASMVDLALMCKLAAALPPHARLILLGDMDQLSSVEAGSVFGDICAGLQAPGSALNRSITRLGTSYRFDPRQGIGRLSSLVNAGLAPEAWELIQEKDNQEVSWVELPAPQELPAYFRARLLPHYRRYLAAAELAEAFAILKEFAILCGLRRGPYGAESINGVIEKILAEEGLIGRDKTWYAGRPLMVSRNDYQLGLFNGDIGIVFADPTDGRLKVFFETEEPGGFRKVLPGRLPEHATVFAMTVHKSQGSEFERTLLMLPDKESPVLSRELIYTGLTRARRSVELWGRQAVFLQAIGQRCRRHSGLMEKLLAP